MVIAALVDSSVGTPTEAGTQLTFPVVAATSVTPGAAWSLALADTAAVSGAAAENAGVVNLLITASTPEKSEFTLTPYRVTASGSLEPVLASPAKSGTEWSAEHATTVADGARASADPRDGPYPENCAYDTKATTVHSADIAFFSSWGDETGSVLYGQEADSTFDVSFQPGAPGLTSNGQVLIGNSDSNVFEQDFGSYVANFVLSVFAGSESETVAPETDHYCINPLWLVSPTSWQGGITEGASLPANENHSGTCATSDTANSFSVGKGVRWFRNSHQATTVTAGFTIFGSALSISSGYSTTVELYWHTGSAFE
ncbi:MAG TPA: hypothetical protein VGP46_09245, partial [Acidimicrobiales bacterium]|nr:hypothetical protein [Acidimicrobiales bacterium]